MNNSLIVVGIGGLLLGGAGGFLVGGKPGGDSSDSSSNLNDTKTNRTKIVAVDENRSRVVTEFSEIYSEPSQTARVQKLLDYYANLDPEQFQAEAAKLSDLPFSERILASYLLFSQWAEFDPIEALAHTDTMGRGGFFVKPTVLQSWASTNPEGASQFLKDNPRDFAMMGGGRGQGAAGTVATEWARQNPEAALAWAKGLEGREAAGAVANVIKQVATEDPVTALAMASDLEDSAKEAAYASIALEWGKDDWSAMESWANGLPANLRDQALAQGVIGLAQTDPEGAAVKVLSLPEGNTRDDSIERVVENWASKDPKAAIDFLLANGSEDAQRGAMRETMTPLTRTNPEAALQLIEGLEDNAVRDRAVSTYVFNQNSGDPQETLTLAATIGDDDDRTRAVGIAASQWIREDEDAANDFFTSTDLIDDETLQRIRERATGNGDGGDRRRRGRRR